jgi:hypothetical protein
MDIFCVALPIRDMPIATQKFDLIATPIQNGNMIRKKIV